MIDAIRLDAIRTWAAKMIEATVSPEAYGDWCYACGLPAPTETIVVRHMVEPLITTDEFVCPACLERVRTVSQEVV